MTELIRGIKKIEALRFETEIWNNKTRPKLKKEAKIYTGDP